MPINCRDMASKLLLLKKINWNHLLTNIPSKIIENKYFVWFNLYSNKKELICIGNFLVFATLSWIKPQYEFYKIYSIGKDNFIGNLNILIIFFDISKDKWFSYYHLHTQMTIYDNTGTIIKWIYSINNKY